MEFLFFCVYVLRQNFTQTWLGLLLILEYETCLVTFLGSIYDNFIVKYQRLQSYGDNSKDVGSGKLTSNLTMYIIYKTRSEPCKQCLFIWGLFGLCHW